MQFIAGSVSCCVLYGRFTVVRSHQTADKTETTETLRYYLEMSGSVRVPRSWNVLLV